MRLLKRSRLIQCIDPSQGEDEEFEYNFQFIFYFLLLGRSDQNYCKILKLNIMALCCQSKFWCFQRGVSWFCGVYSNSGKWKKELKPCAFISFTIAHDLVHDWIELKALCAFISFHFANWVCKIVFVNVSNRKPYESYSVFYANISWESPAENQTRPLLSD